jgi:hypothetical protein
MNANCLSESDTKIDRSDSQATRHDRRLLNGHTLPPPARPLHIQGDRNMLVVTRLNGDRELLLTEEPLDSAPSQLLTTRVTRSSRSSRTERPTPRSPMTCGSHPPRSAVTSRTPTPNSACTTAPPQPHDYEHQPARSGSDRSAPPAPRDVKPPTRRLPMGLDEERRSFTLAAGQSADLTTGGSRACPTGGLRSSAPPLEQAPCVPLFPALLGLFLRVVTVELHEFVHKVAAHRRLVEKLR